MRTLVALALAGALVLAACGGDDASNGKLDVVASFYPVAEAAGRVGGSRVDVTDLTPAGVEPHDVELTAKQVDSVEDADLVVYVGGDFQPAVDAVAEKREAGAVDIGTTGPDPHFWLDPQQMAAAVDEIADAFAAAAPKDGQVFRNNAEKFKAELTELDRDYRQGLEDCDRRDIVTAHDAFGHLAARYGLRQLSIAGISPEAEPDAARLAELTDLIKDKGVTTVFFEALTAPDVAETLAREAKVRTAVLNPIEGLTEDEIDAGKTYVRVMIDNLKTLQAALGCR